MNRLTGLIYHTFKTISIPGWSDMQRESIDVANVVSLRYKHRLFMLFNKDHPYTLVVRYYKPIQHTAVAPTITANGSGTTIYQTTTLEHVITRRYPTKQDCLDEIDSIRLKQQKIDAYMNKMRAEIEK